MRKRKIRPRSEDTTCGYNVESGNWEHVYKMLGLLLALSYSFGQGFISVSFELDLTIPLCIVLLIILFKGTKERPAADLQGIFSSISTKKVTKYNSYINIFILLKTMRTRSTGVI